MLTKRTADVAVATLLLAVGIALAVGGFTMDRLENRHIHPASIPGLVPMILGVVMAGMAAALLVGRMRERTAVAASPGEAGDFGRDELSRFAVVAGLCFAYALVLVGNVHFWVASSLFIGVFTALFDRDAPGGPSGRGGRAVRLAAIAVFAVVLGGAIALLFERGFLVRLP